MRGEISKDIKKHKNAQDLLRLLFGNLMSFFPALRGFEYGPSSFVHRYLVTAEMLRSPLGECVWGGHLFLFVCSLKLKNEYVF